MRGMLALAWDLAGLYVAGTVRPGCRWHRAAVARMVYVTGVTERVSAEQAFALIYSTAPPRAKRLMLAARDAGRDG